MSSAKGPLLTLRILASTPLKNWGEAQRRAYISELEKTAEAVAKGEGIFKDMSFIIPNLRMVACGKHYIFCMPQAGKPAIVLAVLHQSMDLMERLKERML